MSEEKTTHPEHKYSVTFVSKVETKTVVLQLVVGMGVFEHGRFKKLTVRNKSGIGGKEAIVVRCAAEATEIETAAVHRHKFNNKLIHSK